MPALRASTRPQHGQAAAEFALVLPVLALVVLGMLDFARVFYMYEALVNAAREGARYCALHNTLTPIQRLDPNRDVATRMRVVDELDGRVALTAAQIAAITCPDPGLGLPVKVTVSATFKPITPLIDRFFKDPSTGSLKPVVASASMEATG
jgi:Flp pilus assembly protein TadG